MPGAEFWPPGCCLKFISGDQLTTQDRVMVDALDSGQCTDISIEMVSPAGNGIYQGQWRMQTTIGLYFGGMENFVHTGQRKFRKFVSF